jgi:hypothetical protein
VMQVIWCAHVCVCVCVCMCACERVCACSGVLMSVCVHLRVSVCVATRASRSTRFLGKLKQLKQVMALVRSYTHAPCMPSKSIFQTTLQSALAQADRVKHFFFNAAFVWNHNYSGCCAF